MAAGQCVTMNANPHFEEVLPNVVIEALIARHGALRILGATGRALFSRKARGNRVNVDALPAYLRRDLGLPPDDGARQHWDRRY